MQLYVRGADKFYALRIMKVQRFQSNLICFTGQFLLFYISTLRSQSGSHQVVIWVKLLKTEKTIEIQLVRPTKVGGKVLGRKVTISHLK